MADVEHDVREGRHGQRICNTSKRPRQRPPTRARKHGMHAPVSQSSLPTLPGVPTAAPTLALLR